MKTKLKSTIFSTAMTVTAITFFVSCQQQTKSERIIALQNSNDSLSSVIYERDSLMNDMMETFTQIESDLAFIREQRNMISVTTDNRDLQKSRQDQIVQDVKDLAVLLEESRVRLASLESKLKASGAKISSLEKRIVELSADLDARNSEILALTQELEKKNYEVGVLNEQIQTMEIARVEQDKILRSKDSEIDEFNKAYFAMGTSKELIEKGLVSKEGGFLGIGKTKSLSPSAKNELFETLDIRETTSLPVQADKAKLISEHPFGSYEFVKENEKITALAINNPKEFYKFSKYVIVEIN